MVARRKRAPTAEAEIEPVEVKSTRKTTRGKAAAKEVTPTPEEEVPVMRTTRGRGKRTAEEPPALAPEPKKRAAEVTVKAAPKSRSRKGKAAEKVEDVDEEPTDDATTIAMDIDEPVDAPKATSKTRGRKGKAVEQTEEAIPQQAVEVASAATIEVEVPVKAAPKSRARKGKAAEKIEGVVEEQSVGQSEVTVAKRSTRTAKPTTSAGDTIVEVAPKTRGRKAVGRKVEVVDDIKETQPDPEVVAAPEDGVPVVEDVGPKRKGRKAAAIVEEKPVQEQKGPDTMEEVVKPAGRARRARAVASAEPTKAPPAKTPKRKGRAVTATESDNIDEQTTEPKSVLESVPQSTKKHRTKNITADKAIAQAGVHDYDPTELQPSVPSVQETRAARARKATSVAPEAPADEQSTIPPIKEKRATRKAKAAVEEVAAGESDVEKAVEEQQELTEKVVVEEVVEKDVSEKDDKTTEDALVREAHAEEVAQEEFTKEAAVETVVTVEEVTADEDVKEVITTINNATTEESTRVVETEDAQAMDSEEDDSSQDDVALQHDVESQILMEMETEKTETATETVEVKDGDLRPHVSCMDETADGHFQHAGTVDELETADRAHEQIKNDENVNHEDGEDDIEMTDASESETVGESRAENGIAFVQEQSTIVETSQVEIVNSTASDPETDHLEIQIDTQHDAEADQPEPEIGMEMREPEPEAETDKNVELEITPQDVQISREVSPETSPVMVVDCTTEPENTVQRIADITGDEEQATETSLETEVIYSTVETETQHIDEIKIVKETETTILAGNDRHTTETTLETLSTEVVESSTEIFEISEVQPVDDEQPSPENSFTEAHPASEPQTVDHAARSSSPKAAKAALIEIAFEHDQILETKKSEDAEITREASFEILASPPADNGTKVAQPEEAEAAEVDDTEDVFQTPRHRSSSPVVVRSPPGVENVVEVVDEDDDVEMSDSEVFVETVGSPSPDEKITEPEISLAAKVSESGGDDMTEGVEYNEQDDTAMPDSASGTSEVFETADLITHDEALGAVDTTEKFHEVSEGKHQTLSASEAVGSPIDANVAETADSQKSNDLDEETIPQVQTSSPAESEKPTYGFGAPLMSNQPKLAEKPVFGFKPPTSTDAFESSGYKLAAKPAFGFKPPGSEVFTPTIEVETPAEHVEVVQEGFIANDPVQRLEVVDIPNETTPVESEYVEVPTSEDSSVASEEAVAARHSQHSGRAEISLSSSPKASADIKDTIRSPRPVLKASPPPFRENDDSAVHNYLPIEDITEASREISMPGSLAEEPVVDQTAPNSSSFASTTVDDFSMLSSPTVNVSSEYTYKTHLSDKWSKKCPPLPSDVSPESPDGRTKKRARSPTPILSELFPVKPGSPGGVLPPSSAFEAPAPGPRQFSFGETSQTSSQSVPFSFGENTSTQISFEYKSPPKGQSRTKAKGGKKQLSTRPNSLLGHRHLKMQDSKPAANSTAERPAKRRRPAQDDDDDDDVTASPNILSDTRHSGAMVVESFNNTTVQVKNEEGSDESSEFEEDVPMVDFQEEAGISKEVGIQSHDVDVGIIDSQVVRSSGAEVSFDEELSEVSIPMPQLDVLQAEAQDVSALPDADAHDIGFNETKVSFDEKLSINIADTQTTDTLDTRDREIKRTEAGALSDDDWSVDMDAGDFIDTEEVEAATADTVGANLMFPDKQPSAIQDADDIKNGTIEISSAGGHHEANLSSAEKPDADGTLEESPIHESDKAIVKQQQPSETLQLGAAATAPKSRGFNNSYLSSFLRRSEATKTNKVEENVPTMRLPTSTSTTTAAPRADSSLMTLPNPVKSRLPKPRSRQNLPGTPPTPPTRPRSSRIAAPPPPAPPSLAPRAPIEGSPGWQTMLEREQKLLVKKNTEANIQPPVVPHKHKTIRKPVPRPPSPTPQTQARVAAQERRRRKLHFERTGVELGAGESVEEKGKARGKGKIPELGKKERIVEPKEGRVRWGAPLEESLVEEGTKKSPSAVKAMQPEKPAVRRRTLDKWGNVVKDPVEEPVENSPVVIKKVVFKGE